MWESSDGTLEWWQDCDVVTSFVLIARGPGNAGVNKAFGHRDSSQACLKSLCCRSGMTKLSCLGYLEINVQADVDCCCWSLALRLPAGVPVGQGGTLGCLLAPWSS